MVDLSCPTPENYAAIAKQLHETALKAEARIYVLEQQLRAAANRPTIVQVTTALQTGIASGSASIIGPGITAFTTLFNNTAVASDQGIGNNGDDFMEVLGEGVYEVGLFCNAIASGAVTVNSFRVVRIQQYTPDPTSLGPLFNGYRLVDNASYTEFESNVGNGVDFAFSGEFRLGARDIIFFTLEHNNAASTMNISVGALAYISRISDATVTTVL